MSFASKNSLILLVFVISMSLQPSTSFTPCSSRRKSAKDSSYNNALFLVPSQVRIPKSRRAVTSESSSDEHSPNPLLQLIPSQILKSTNHLQQQMGRLQMSESSDVVTSNMPTFSTEPLATSPETSSRRKRRRTRRRKHMTKSEFTTKNGKNRRKRILTGNYPDVHWRAVPMNHLRLHPLFCKLPPPESIKRLDTMEDARLFSQDSWQWDALHEGRCTTSKAAAALGILEPKAGEALNIPKSWRRGGKSAYFRLRQQPLQTLEEMNRVLCHSDSSSTIQQDEETDNGPVWVIPRPGKDGRMFPFAAKYLMKITPEERKDRRRQAEEDAVHEHFLSVRMSWGTAQEATSLLTALNYFWKRDPGVRLEEVGMCGAGLNSNQTEDSVLVGASPDGILCHSNGTIEALEVKNHCPFVPASYMDEDSLSGPSYAARQMPFRNPINVPPLYVPQMQMEMLCVGPECRSAVMVRQTATNGAVIMRMYRDDEWIEEMMYWLNRFKRDFVDREIIPPTDFFWDDENDGDRYRAFLEWTRELSNKVRVLDHVKHHEIQRVVATSRNITSLFLD